MVCRVISALFAHDGAPAYDMSQPVVLKNAVVTSFKWTNPHPLIQVETDKNQRPTKGGEIEKYASRLIGWIRNTVKPRDVITIYIWQNLYWPKTAASELG